MSKLLTQQEIEVLLTDAATGSAESSNINPQSSNVQATRYDFQMPQQLPENQAQALQAVNKIFTANVEKYFLLNLEKQVSLTPLGTNSLFLSEYLLTVTNPAAAYIFRIENFDSLGLLEFSSSFAVSAVASLLGGRQESDVKPRSLTILEQRIFKNVAEKILAELQSSWQKSASISFAIELFETDSEHLQISIPTEVMLVTSFEVNYEKQKFNLNIAYPAAVINKLFSNQSINLKGKPSDQNHVNKFVKQQLYNTNLEVTTVLGTSSVSIRELLELKQGDIIRTKVPMNGEVSIIIGNKLNIKGKPGVSNGHLAVSVTSTSTETVKEI